MPILWLRKAWKGVGRVGASWDLYFDGVWGPPCGILVLVGRLVIFMRVCGVSVIAAVSCGHRM